MTEGISKTQLIAYLEKNKLVKVIDGVYYLTDKLLVFSDSFGSPKAALKEFCEEIQIPFQVFSPTGSKYTVKYVTDNIGKMYLKVLAKVDKEDLIEVTKKYYKDTEYPVTIKHYFENNVWETALENKEVKPFSFES